MLRCVCFYTVPHSSFEVRHCVQHALWSNANGFLHCSLEVQRVSHSCQRASRSLQIRNSRSRSTQDRQPPCSASTTTRSRGKELNNAPLPCLPVSALCPARNFRTRSNHMTSAKTQSSSVQMQCSVDGQAQTLLLLSVVNLPPPANTMHSGKSRKCQVNTFKIS